MFSCHVASAHFAPLSLAVVINVITATAAYCPFVRATFRNNQSLRLHTTTHHSIETLLQKYHSRGWNTLDSSTSTAAERNEMRTTFRAGNRQLEDRCSWIIPLDITPFRPIQFAISPVLWTHPIESWYWKLTVDHESRITLLAPETPFGN